MDNVLVCTGFREGEVLPDKGSPAHPTQARVLAHIESSPLSKILIAEGNEIKPHVKEVGAVELVGAWYDRCVCTAAYLLLCAGVPVRINPALTLRDYEVSGFKQENIAEKRALLEREISSDGFYVRRDGDWLEFTSE